MKYVVDRIEGEYAVCEAEDRSMVDIPLSDLPPEIKEGDHVSYQNGAYTIPPADDERRKRIQNLMDNLWHE